MSSVLASSWSLVAWLGLLVALVELMRAHQRSRPPSDALGWTWRGIALLGFALTWTFMIRMALEDIARYPSLGAWGRQSNLFFDAYRRVTESPPAWWWSQHLMAWALAGSLWFAVEGRRRALRSWAYLWLAMCVAVSVALPIFAQRMRADGEHDRVEPREVPLLTAFGVVLATFALVATPFVRGAPFIVAMLVLHAGLLLPAFGTPRGARAVAVRPLAIAVAVSCSALHVVATVRLHDTALSALVDVVLADPAQSSISSDVVLTWLACTLLVATLHGPRRALAFFALAPVISLGAAFTWAVLLPRRPAAEPREMLPALSEKST
jgi:ABC-type amino acid transport system permease subunit